jgi:hypothetical protein
MAGGVFGVRSRAALPVELLDFQAFAEGENVRLRWATASEINADRYEVEHSADGYLFNEIGELPASGGVSVEQHYTLLHERPLPGLNYYRLRQKDLDGSFYYSPVRSVDFAGQAGGAKPFRVFPNPVSTTLWVALEVEGDFWVKVFDTQGRQAPVEKNDSVMDVSALAPGVYFLWISDGRRSWSEKVLVER